MTVQSRSVKALVSLFLLTSTALVRAQSGTCLADMKSAASGDLGYRERVGRCEGTLQRFVSNSGRVALVGYSLGSISIPAVGPQELLIVPVAEEAADSLALRATSLTSTTRYQMDSVNVKPNVVFRWQIGVIQQAIALGQSTVGAMGIAACSQRCVDHPDTVYWPVTLAENRKQAPILLVRSGVRAGDVQGTLQDLGTNKIFKLTFDAELTPNAVTKLAIPAGLAVGKYRLRIEARDQDSGQSVGSLQAVIYIPSV